jgi:LmbE family N-acetylglucosaminyl deacetylase
MRNILIVAAHPDDEVLGCGGTITRLASEGDAVHILILATGLTARIGFDPVRDGDLLRVHRERALRAGLSLGAKSVSFGDFPDQKMDTVPILEITHRIEREIESLRPSVIFTHHGGDLNMDHVIAFRATLTAARPKSGSCVRSIHAYEVLSSTEWSFQKFEPRFEPNLFYDISETLARKLEAMKIYETEVRQPPHPRSPAGIEATALRWGGVLGLESVEAFQTVWEVR